MHEIRREDRTEACGDSIEFVLCDQFPHAVTHAIAEGIEMVVEAWTLQLFDGCQASGHGQGMGVVCAGEKDIACCRVELLHQPATTSERGARITVCHRFPERGEIGCDTCYPLVATKSMPKPCNYFVENKNGFVLGCDPTQRVQEIGFRKYTANGVRDELKDQASYVLAVACH